MTMTLHRKKRLEVIIEVPALSRLETALHDIGITGYTILPALAGAGRSGRWTRDGLIGDTDRMVMLVAIFDAQLVDTLVERIFPVVTRQSGVASLSDVEVLRADLF